MAGNVRHLLSDILASGYARIGSHTPPTNQANGDLSFTRGTVGSDAAFGTGGDSAFIWRVSGTLTEVSGTNVFAGYYPTLAPAADSAGEFRTLNFLSIIPPTTDFNFSLPITGGYFEGVRPRGSGNLTRATAPGGGVGVQGIGVVFDSSADDAGTVTLATGGVFYPYKRPSGSFTTKALTTGVGVWLPNPDDPNGALVGTLVGIELEKWTRGTTGNAEFRNAGKMVYTPTTQTISGVGNQLVNTGRQLNVIVSAGGITLDGSVASIATTGAFNGQYLTVTNVDTADTLTLQDMSAVAGTLLRLPGAANLALGPRDSATFMYVSALTEWWCISTVNL